MKQAYAILLPQTLPQELHAFLEHYLYLFHEQNFLLCDEVEEHGYFLQVSMQKNDKSKRLWRVRLPIQYALAVADMSDKESLPIGFLS